MADLSELRGFLMVITFLGTFVFLVTIIPVQFTVPFYTGRNVTTPDFWEPSEIQSFNETWTYRMNETGGGGYSYQGFYYVPIEIEGEWFGGHDLTFFYKPANDSNLELNIKHYWSEWIIILLGHQMEWINHQGFSRNIYLDIDEMEEDRNSLRYKVSCSHFYMVAQFGYNTTTYSTVADAWNNHDLWIRLGIDFDNMAMGFNAWNLVSSLIFFQLPDVHWVINVLIKIPFWACIAYLTAIFILKVISVLKPFGGGSP